MLAADRTGGKCLCELRGIPVPVSKGNGILLPGIRKKNASRRFWQKFKAFKCVSLKFKVLNYLKKNLKIMFFILDFVGYYYILVYKILLIPKKQGV